MTTIEPMAPLPEEPLLPAAVEPEWRHRRNVAPMPMVRVNLLPDEVVATRRGHRTRRVVLVALVVLALVLGGVAFFVRSGIGGAKSELAAAESINANLLAQQGQYSEVVTAQNDLKAALDRLGELAAADIGWADVVRAIRTAAPAGLTLTGVDGTGAADSGAAGSVGGAPGGTGTAAPADGVPATVIITGSATDPKTVAAYIDALSRSPLLANVLATGVSSREGGDYTFGITADVTAKAQPHRFDTTPGGK